MEPWLARLVLSSILGTVVAIWSLALPDEGDSIQIAVVDEPPHARDGALRVTLDKLPTGSVEPQGWLRTQLVLARDGMIGHLEEISPWCDFQRSAWANPSGQGENGWEELPYWLRGFTSLAFVLNDRELKARAVRWLDAILKSQREDGYFGPRANLDSLDLWPNMVVLYAMRTLHEATGDPRVIPFMRKYFRWQLTLPKEKFIPSSWQHVRGADNLDSIYWLYRRTKENWLLDLAKRNHECTAPWENGIASLHGVNFAQGFREPAQFYQQSNDAKHLEATRRIFDEMRQLYGQVPGGMYGADENARPGYNGPRQGTETCAFAEMMYSLEELTRITGNTFWADRCEDVAFNSFPASLTPDLRALHYLTCPNQVVLDRANKAPMIQNGGDMFSYTPYEQYRCCQHNVAFGWPYYAEHLWMATQDNGLACPLYAPCKIRATVANGDGIGLSVETAYPFDDTIKIRVADGTTEVVPIYLRVPSWASRAELRVCNQTIVRRGVGGRWIRVARRWRSSDKIVLRLPMQVTVTAWTANRGSVSVHRGPLTYSLCIGEEWRQYATGRPWPGFEVWPRTPWNYGLVVDPKNPSKFVKVARRTQVGEGMQPFSLENAPIVLRAKARRIPNWQLESNNLIEEVQQSPVRSAEPMTEVELVPMGCARLRVSAFPVIGSGPDAREWPEHPISPTASWVNPSDTCEALTDGVLPSSSADTSIPRFTWWDHLGTTEWVQQTFAKPVSLSGCDVYWFDDEPIGGRCRLPESWRVLWQDGHTWREVEPLTRYPLNRDCFCFVRFKPICTRAVRIEVKLQPGFSGGILEWRLMP